MSVPKRLLALEIRTSKLGFAVLESPATLLDWGVRSFREAEEPVKSAISDRIGILIAFYKPSAIVIRLRQYHSPSQNERFMAALSAVRAEARRTMIKFVVLTISQVTRHFASRGQVTKHDVAASLARRYQELSWKLPVRRKSYQSEAPAMLVFDALANGIAHLERESQLGRPW